MIYIVLTILISIIVIVLLHKIASKNGFNEHMKHIPDNEMSKVATLFMTVMFFVVIYIFGNSEFQSDTRVKIFLCLLLFNFIISFTVSKFILGLMYKHDHYSLDELKKKEKEAEIKQKIKERNKMSIWKKLAILGAIVGGLDSNSKDKVNEKLEKEMDYNYLNEHEKELVRKGDYDPTNFEYPENGEKLGEDDYYSDDESWK